MSGPRGKGIAAAAVQVQRGGTRMTRRALRVWGIVYLVAATCFCTVAIAHAASLDENDDIKLGVRAYTAARVGSEQTDSHISNVDRSGNVTDRQTLTQSDLPGLAGRSPAPEPLLRRGRARPRPAPSDARRVRTARVAERPALQGPQAQVPPDVPRRVRGHLRLRSEGVSDGGAVSRHQPGLPASPGTVRRTTRDRAEDRAWSAAPAIACAT